MNQAERLVEYLRTHEGGITDREGLLKLGIGSVASRVHQLEKQGKCIFKHIREKGKNRYGDDVCYVRYFLEEE